MSHVLSGEISTRHQVSCRTCERWDIELCHGMRAFKRAIKARGWTRHRGYWLCRICLGKALREEEENLGFNDGR